MRHMAYTHAMAPCSKQDIHLVKKKGQFFEDTVKESLKEDSTRKLPLLAFSFVHMLKDFGFLHVPRLLVSKPASAASLLYLGPFAAVDVCGGRTGLKKTTPSLTYVTDPHPNTISRFMSSPAHSLG